MRLASRPRRGSASRRPRPRWISSRAAARRSSSRRMGWPAGKGVVVAATEAEARAAIAAAMVAGALGEAGATLVIEECLDRR